MKTLQEWMDHHKLNDAAVAERHGALSRSQVSRIRRGKSLPTRENAKRLEEITRIPAGRFLLGEAAPASNEAA